MTQNEVQRLREENKRLRDQLRQAQVGQAVYDEVQGAIRIRTAWAAVSHNFVTNLRILLASIPSAVDMQVFEADDWQRWGEIEMVLKQAEEALYGMKRAVTSVNGARPVVVDAVDD